MPTLKHAHMGVLVLIIAIIAVVVVLSASSGAALLFVLAIAPTAFILWHFYHADKYKHESPKLLGITFALGAILSLVVALPIELEIPQPSTADIVGTFLYFLVAVGLVEETVKFASVRVYAYRSKHFDEPMDGIVFGVAAALGFATIENILYVFQNGIETALFRAIVSVPGHAFWGAILGFYLGEAKVRSRPLLALQGLAIAVFLHGLFDTIATEIPSDIVAAVLLLGVVYVVYIKVVRKEVSEAEAESPYRTPSSSVTPTPSRAAIKQQVGGRFCSQCGTPVEIGDQFCPTCGKLVT